MVRAPTPSVSMALTAGSVAGGGLADTIRIIGAYGGGTIFGDANGVTTAGTGTGGAADGAGPDLLQGKRHCSSKYLRRRRKTTPSQCRVACSKLVDGGNANLVDGGNGRNSITIVGHAAALGYGDGTITGGNGNDTIATADHNTGGAGVVLATISGGAGMTKSSSTVVVRC